MLGSSRGILASNVSGQPCFQWHSAIDIFTCWVCSAGEARPGLSLVLRQPPSGNCRLLPLQSGCCPTMICQPCQIDVGPGSPQIP